MLGGRGRSTPPRHTRRLLPRHPPIPASAARRERGQRGWSSGGASCHSGVGALGWDGGIRAVGDLAAPGTAPDVGSVGHAVSQGGCTVCTPQSSCPASHVAPLAAATRALFVVVGSNPPAVWAPQHATCPTSWRALTVSSGLTLPVRPAPSCTRAGWPPPASPRSAHACAHVPSTADQQQAWRMHAAAHARGWRATPRPRTYSASVGFNRGGDSGVRDHWARAVDSAGP